MTKIIELVDDLKLNQQIEGKKKAYIDSVQYRLFEFSKFIKSEYQIIEAEEVEAKHIKRFIQHRQERGKEQNITINNHLASIKVFFNYLVEEEYINEEHNPTRRIRNLKEEKKVIMTFNDDEVKRIINDVKEITYSNIRDKLMIIFLFETGIRASELISIKNEDITRKSIKIHGKGSKQRLVYISRIMRRYMRRFEEKKAERFKNKYPDELEEYYFLDQMGMQLHRSRLNKILREHGNNIGVRKEIRCSPHDCRHYFAQKQLRNGIDVYSLSRLLGHFDTQMTAKYLRGIEQEEILNIGNRYSPLRNTDI